MRKEFKGKYYYVQKFFKFLVKNNMLYEYTYYFKNLRRNNDFKGFVLRNNHINYIACAFSWESTSNEEIWSNLNEKWCKELGY